MTRKHFLAIAETIRTLRLEQAQREEVAAAFAEALSETNMRFNAQTFYKACGVLSPVPVAVVEA